MRNRTESYIDIQGFITELGSWLSILSSLTLPLPDVVFLLEFEGLPSLFPSKSDPNWV